MNWPLTILSWKIFLPVDTPFLPNFHSPVGISLCVFWDRVNFSFLNLSIAFYGEMTATGCWRSIAATSRRLSFEYACALDMGGGVERTGKGGVDF